ncbi:MAG: response regulator [Planctomycetes bacterium]|nr:response regulator [Planctomycetota bacterium]
MSEPEHGKKILVVDDSETIRTLLKGELAKRGYAVHTAENGSEGLKKAVDLGPDLIISDINMPEVDGWEFCWLVRKNEKIRHIPVIFLTDRDEVSDRVRGLEIGAEDYITKPFQVNELVNRMETVMRRRRTAAAGPGGQTTLMGQLNQFNLPDLLQNINMLSKSGALEIRRNNLARIVVQGGEVFNAEIGPLRGKKAFYRMLTWKDGIFEFKEFLPNIAKAFHENTIKLILDGLKQEDEIHRLRKEFPTDECVVLINFNDEFFRYNFNQETRNFLNLIQENQTVGRILDASPLEDLKVFKALQVLQNAGILRVRPPEKDK